MDQAKVGRLITQLRKEQNLTQASLGEKLGVTDKTVSNWERGLRSPDISILNDLSKILNITTNELLNGSRTSSSHNKKITQTEYEKINEVLLLFLNNNYSNCNIHILESKDNNYYINGLIVHSSDKEFININFIENISKCNSELVYSYEYSLNIKNDEVYKIGNILLYEHNSKRNAIPINDILNEIKIYVVKDNINVVDKSNLLIKDTVLTIKYINQELKEKNIKIPLVLNEILANNKIQYNFI